MVLDALRIAHDRAAFAVYGQGSTVRQRGLALAAHLLLALRVRGESARDIHGRADGAGTACDRASHRTGFVRSRNSEARARLHPVRLCDVHQSTWAVLD